ncbi:TetR/AcrR family transcriptional regulator [Streptococcus suis]|uniref:TetR/AcrR family transcriptional regulator n=1 Tax=Streptococcus suis TaxID=1307 RepID=A0A540UXH9_STRSU|nr:TetR/AcrR family transcriptional regulator [Streptococcus suis]TQE89167.1 TetR/AcrR family transcriptional regulator [Streptococcus suis]
MTESAKIKLQQALILLLDEEEFGRISVSKICKEAGVHRSTFYHYYDNQFDLLEDANQYLTQLFLAEFQSYPANSLPIETDLTGDAYLISYLQFVKDHQKIYQIYLHHELDFHHKEHFEHLLATIFTPRFHAQGIQNPVQIAYVSSFFLAGITQVVSKWVRDGCAESIEEMADIIQICISRKQ